MKIAIIGATGFIGSHAAGYLSQAGHEVTAVSRSAGKARKLFGEETEIFEWDAKGPEGLLPLIEKTDVLINLAGQDIGESRWTEKRKKLLRESRVNTGRYVKDAILGAKKRPKMLIQASAIGIYGVNHYGTKTRVPGDDSFMATLTAEWEKSVSGLIETGVTTVLFRQGVVLGKESGMLAKVRTPMKFFIGGKLGSGKQWLSWVHKTDVVRAMEFVIENDLEGRFNIASPEPVMQKDFFKILGKVMQRPSWMPVPAFVLKIVFGKMAEETILASQRAMPDRLLEAGFSFSFSSLEGALKDLLWNQT